MPARLSDFDLIPSSITVGTGPAQRSETAGVIQGPPLSEEMLAYLEREEEFVGVDPWRTAPTPASTCS